MTETSDRYRSNAAEFTARVEAVPTDAWENPSPCEDWTARDVVRHCVDVSGMFLGYVDHKLPPAPSVDDDPVAAWSSARDAIQAALDDPQIAKAEYEGLMGTSTFETGISRFVVPDVLLHTWDLARATGLDESLDDAPQMEEILETWQPLDDMMRTPGGFGPKVKPPKNADAQTRLLAFTGRRV